MGGPSGTVTFLFTDIEGSTALWELDASTMQVTVEHHDDVVRAAMADHGGVVFSTSGDGFAVAFDRAGDAAAAALAMQAGLASASWPAELAVRVRIGIHTGEVQERDGDYFGPAVNRAARIMAAAPPGDILLSATAAALLPLEDRGRLAPLGLHELRGVPEPVELFGLSGDGGDWRGRALAASKPTHVHLPAPASELVGRQAEVVALVEQVGRRRLITMAGPGGVGKTRLALELAWLSAERFEGGVWFVGLAGVTEPGLVAAAIAAGVEARPRDGASFEEALVDHLEGAAAMVVIDNCEHLVDAVAAIVERVMAECPGVTVVATSREALGLAGEVVWPVPSLDPELEGPELFRARMFEVDASTPHADYDEQIVALCRRLDGIPLAIELAAGQTRVLTIPEIVERVDDRFTLLRGSTRGRMERHQTLRATVQWSYRLLEPAEQLLFDRFSVFVGGAALEAVVAVCAGDGVEPDEVLDLLASLVNKSMLVADRSEDRTRFRALETLRDYGRERLEERDDATDRRDRHLAYFADWAERTEAAYTGPRSTFTVPDQRELDNLHAALQWAIARSDLDRAVVIAVTTRGWMANWLRPDHLDWLDQTAALAAEQGVEVPTVQGARAGWLVFMGDLDGATRAARASIARAPAADDPSTREAWENLAFASYLKGDQAALEVASVGLQALGARGTTPKEEAFILFMLCVVDAALDPRRAAANRDRLDALAAELDSPFVDLLAATARVLETVMSMDPSTTAVRAARALELADEVQSLAFADNIRGMIGASLVGTDSPDTAATFHRQLSQIYEDRDWGVLWWTLEAVASHWAKSGEFEGAAVLYGNLEAAGRDSRGAFEDRQPALDAGGAHPEVVALMAQGAAMSRDEIVVYCLDRLRV